MAYRRASVIDLYLCTKFHSNRRKILWTDRRTDGRTYGRTDIEAGFIRSTQLSISDQKLDASLTSIAQTTPAFERVVSKSSEAAVIRRAR